MSERIKRREVFRRAFVGGTIIFGATILHEGASVANAGEGKKNTYEGSVDIEEQTYTGTVREGNGRYRFNGKADSGDQVHINRKGDKIHDQLNTKGGESNRKYTGTSDNVQIKETGKK